MISHDVGNYSPLFGPQAFEKFSDVTYDIEEAGNCIATERTTAAVFHLMRVLEVALRAIGVALGIPDPVKEADRNWAAMLRNIRNKIDQNAKAGEQTWQLGQPWRTFYDGAYNDLSAIKTAWRNPVMHVEGVYDPARALHIYEVVKGFVQHLATNIGQA